MKEVSRFIYSTREISKVKSFLDQEGHSDATAVPEEGLVPSRARRDVGSYWGGEFVWRRLVDTGSADKQTQHC